jgi:F-type H+-transporting ATPase subunit b
MHEAVLTAAAGAEHPLIDLDLTVALQLAIFTVLGVLASRLLFRPYLRLRDERAAGIEGAREEAVRMSAQAEAQMGDYGATLKNARARALDERQKLRAEAAAHEREVVERTRREAITSIETARASIRSQTDTARRQLALRADALSRGIAAKLLGRPVQGPGPGEEAP